MATITPVSYAATEQVSLNLKNTGLSISDADAGSGSMTVTLAVTEGTLTITAGTSGAVVSGSGTSSVTLTGTVAQINALLNTNGTSTVSYIDNTDTPSASATLTLTVDDNGNTGTGGDLIASDSTTINITAVNDAPVFSATSSTLTLVTNAGASGAVSFTEAALAAYFTDPEGSADGVDTLAVIGGTLTSRDRHRPGRRQCRDGRHHHHHRQLHSERLILGHRHRWVGNKLRRDGEHSPIARPPQPV